MKTRHLLVSLLTLTAVSALADNSMHAATADNTALNKRDAHANTLTPVDQSRGTTADVEVTRQIRELLVKDSSLSSKAHNVKIITLGGMTTLRGPVENTEERAKIASLAVQVVGSEAYVRNKLEVKAQK